MFARVFIEEIDRISAIQSFHPTQRMPVPTVTMIGITFFVLFNIHVEMGSSAHSPSLAQLYQDCKAAKF
jgi:hypothetical protein